MFQTEPPQLNWVSPDTRYITLSIGGNDVGFADVLKDCIYGIGRLVDGGTGSPGCRFRHDKAVRDRIALLGSDHCYLESCSIVPSLTHLYEQIQARAPQAIIRVVTYPKLFTQNPGSRVAVYTKVANKSALYIDGEDAKWINQMGDLLNNRIANSAQLAAEVQRQSAPLIRILAPCLHLMAMALVTLTHGSLRSSPLMRSTHSIPLPKASAPLLHTSPSRSASIQQGFVDRDSGSWTTRRIQEPVALVTLIGRYATRPRSWPSAATALRPFVTCGTVSPSRTTACHRHKFE